MGQCFSRFLHNEDEHESGSGEYGRDRHNSLNFIHESDVISMEQQRLYAQQRYLDLQHEAKQKGSSLMRHSSLGMDSDKMYRIDSSPSTFFGDSHSSVIFRQQQGALTHRGVNNSGNGLRGRSHTDRGIILKKCLSLNLMIF